MVTFYTSKLLVCILGIVLFGKLSFCKPLDGRIVGGIGTTIRQFPHQVSLQQNGKHICGAVIIHNQTLLTAAHCIEKVKAETLKVRAGSSELYLGGVLLKVRRIIGHEAFNLPTRLNNDIALIILDEPLKLSRTVHVISLMTEQDMLLPKSSLFVSGWGSISPNQSDLSLRLRYTGVHEIDYDNCTASYRGATKVTSTMMCAGMEAGEHDSCQGDSGGPLIGPVNGVMKLAGIVSWGISCAQSSHPGVYTRVADYGNWIKENMRKSEGFLLQS